MSIGELYKGQPAKRSYAQEPNAEIIAATAMFDMGNIASLRDKGVVDSLPFPHSTA